MATGSRLQMSKNFLHRITESFLYLYHKVQVNAVWFKFQSNLCAFDFFFPLIALFIFAYLCNSSESLESLPLDVRADGTAASCAWRWRFSSCALLWPWIRKCSPEWKDSPSWSYSQGLHEWVITGHLVWCLGGLLGLFCMGECRQTLTLS